MPLQATSGAASYDAFGGGVAAVPQYIEDVFQTWLYQGNDTGQTITNGIDLSTKGGLVWTKRRNGILDHFLLDTARGGTNSLQTNTTNSQDIYSYPGYIPSYNTTGYTLGDSSDLNGASNTYASWTFRKQPKFFDVVTWTGNGATTRDITHSLGSKPGCIIIKRTDTTSNWVVTCRADSGSYYLGGVTLNLNRDAAYSTSEGGTVDDGLVDYNNTNSTTFKVADGFTVNAVNASGGTYVAYLFAHNAGGFGLTGTDNVISCGSYTGNGSATGPVITLGYEPQWLMIKKSSSTGNWQMLDNMRGMPVGSADAALRANLTSAESSVEYVSPTSTGFQITSTSGEVNTSAATYIYIAIRRGPMKVPTSGTEVFAPVAQNGSANAVVSTGFVTDLVISKQRSAAIDGTNYVIDRLRGDTTSTFTALATNSTLDEATWSATGAGFGLDRNTSVIDNYHFTNAGITSSIAYWNFKRAPSFFDEVCYNGDGTDNRAIAHNLTVAPEFIIVKRRDGTSNWSCYCQYITGGASSRVYLQTTAASVTSINDWAATNPTATNFYISSTSTAVNNSGNTYVSYLFATCAGVSKVGSYTGTGTTLQIDCGFTAGARFVLIRRTSTGGGDWYVWDTARGIVSGNDSYLLLNSTAAEVTNTDYIDTYSAGFEISSTAPAAINASGGSFIFFAVA